jgi:hypothetical protein
MVGVFETFKISKIFEFFGMEEGYESFRMSSLR